MYGMNLASTLLHADNKPWPPTLNGTTLDISGVPVPVNVIAPGQVNFQIPWLFNYYRFLNRPFELRVTQGVQTSAAYSVSFVAFAPALFSTNFAGTGQGAILIANTPSLAAPAGMFPGSRPAKHNDFVEIYCTGLGAVNNQPNDGDAVPDGSATTLTKPTVTIGAAAANVTFSGLAPTFVGLYQVDAQIPAAAPAGNAVPVTLAIGGVTSNTVTIAIQ
jgi:uncharacterized protein (TIGR03437 family)